MSISTIQGNIRRSKTKITDLRKKLSKEQDNYSKAMKEILNVKKTIRPTTSQSILKTKLSKIDRLQKNIANSSKEQSALNKKITDEEKKLHIYEERLLREETAQLKKMDVTRTKMEREHQQSQRTLLSELTNYKHSIALQTERLVNSYDDEEKYDVFISHASDDKEDFVKPLAFLLKESGVKIWYDEYELTWGKGTRRSIDKGLSNCRFGIVVLSEAFIRKGWTNYELDGLMGRHVGESQNLILPIWHQVNYETVRKYSPSLADITALTSDRMSIEEIAEQLIALLKESSFDEEE
ncbi:TIR domain-containing protein [Priestia sp. FSL W8-0524]|uniref:TIR domain-containing protein n=1 Tax=Priestia sp. FSL W8-0524 TaxID=2954625 RepID=UPI0030FBA155